MLGDRPGPALRRRFILGLGASYREWNEGWFGLPNWGRPVAHLRETVEVIRLVIARGHTGELDRYDGEYHQHGWSTFGGTFAPPLRAEIPVWLFTWQSGVARLAAEIADGLATGACTGEVRGIAETFYS